MSRVLARFPELDQATPELKLAVIDELWESVRRADAMPVGQSIREELDRREKAGSADESLALSPAQARALLRR